MATPYTKGCPYRASYNKGCICNACLRKHRLKSVKANARTKASRRKNKEKKKADFALSTVKPASLNFEAHCLHHRSALMSYATRFTGRPDTAEDLVQDTYARAYMFWPQFVPSTGDTDRDVLMWMRRIMSNTFFTHCKREKKRKDAVDSYSEITETEPDEGTSFEGAICELLNKLKPEHKELMEMKYLRGQSYQDMATQLALTPAKVQKRLWRARNALKILIIRAGGAGLVNSNTFESTETPQPQSDGIESIVRGDDSGDFSVTEAVSYTGGTR